MKKGKESGKVEGGMEIEKQASKQANTQRKRRVLARDENMNEVCRGGEGKCS